MSIFQIRKDIFDYLSANLSNVCEVLPSHPGGNLSNLTKPKLVVSLLRDATLGEYISTDIESPEIQITIYSSTELMLTKPLTGVCHLVKSLMRNYTNNNFSSSQLIRDFYPNYNYDNFTYFSFLIYRFYSKN